MTSWFTALKAMIQQLLEPQQSQLQPIRVEAPKEQQQQRVQRRRRR